MSDSKIKPVSLALGAAFIGSFAIASTAFAMNDLPQGYMVSADAQAEKGKEGKCGEGKCGAEKKADQEGKCGEGKCGADKKAGKEGKCGAEKKAEKEGKCGEGKCGGSH